LHADAFERSGWSGLLVGFCLCVDTAASRRTSARCHDPVNANRSHYDARLNLPQHLSIGEPHAQDHPRRADRRCHCAAHCSFAKADCKAYPKAEWMKEADAKAKIAAQGYTIDKFKVDGNCYEIYGTNKEGKKVEIYYDAKTLEPVKTEIKK
jgi:hypothetical protein